MKNVNKNGFTLVEVIAVVVILGLLAGISIPIISKYIKSSEEKYNEKLESNLLVVAKNYYSDRKKNIKNISGDYYILSFEELLTLGYLNDEVKDYKGSSCNNSYVVVNKTNSTFTTCFICKDNDGNNTYENLKDGCNVSNNNDDKHTLILVYGDGSSEEKDIDNINELPSGDSVKTKKPYCTFSGWYTSSDGDEIYDSLDINLTDNKIYAHWNNCTETSDDDVYKIYFICNDNTIKVSDVNVNDSMNQTCSFDSYTQIGWSTSKNELNTYDSKDFYKIDDVVTSNMLENANTSKIINLYPIYVDLSTNYVLQRLINYSDGSSFCDFLSCNIPFNLNIINSSGSLMTGLNSWNIYINDSYNKNISFSNGSSSFTIENITRSDVDIYSKGYDTKVIKICSTIDSSICISSKNILIPEKDYIILTHRFYNGTGSTSYTDIITGLQDYDNISYDALKTLYVYLVSPSYNSITGETAINGYSRLKLSNYSSIPSNLTLANNKGNIRWRKVDSSTMNIDVNFSLVSGSGGAGGFVIPNSVISEGKSIVYTYFPCFKDSNKKYTCHE